MLTLLSFLGLYASARAASPSEPLQLSTPSSLWVSEPGEGFRHGAQEFDLSAGPGVGLRVLGGHSDHNWALAAVQYGCVVSEPHAGTRGNWEILGEVFGGGQYYASTAYLVGIAPLLRYNFGLGHGWVPFIDAGAGLTATSIRDGDLSTTFEFNVQGGVGLHYFIRDDLALTGQFRFIHISNASTHYPNVGVNNGTFLLGVTWLF